MARPKQRCTVEGCDRWRKGQGLCAGHYHRMWRTGRLDPDVPFKDNMDPPDLKFQRNIVISERGCWEWQGGLDPDGYARFQNGRGARWVFERFGGVIPDGYEIDHLCRNRACVNPHHLEAVTPQVNQLRGFSVSGKNARKTHCIRGHEFTPENTYRPPNTRKRECRECLRIRALRYARQAS